MRRHRLFALGSLLALATGPGLGAQTTPAFVERDGREMVRWVDGGGAVTELLAPPRVVTAVRREPRVLAEMGQELTGLAWLEGREGRLAVRFAPWNGASWGAVEWVSSPGPGSQLALTGAVLADGSELLLWSAFDGTDDEILWSRRGAGGWSEPQRLAADNRVPDITPTVLAAGRGAVAAWGRFEGGQYRVVLSRLEAGRWSEPLAVGPMGSLFPELSRLTLTPAAARTTGLAGGCRLSFRTARPRGWQVLDLDAAGRPRRTASVAAAGATRPGIEDAADGLRFNWPEETAETSPTRFVPWETLP